MPTRLLDQPECPFKAQPLPTRGSAPCDASDYVERTSDTDDEIDVEAFSVPCDEEFFGGA